MLADSRCRLVVSHEASGALFDGAGAERVFIDAQATRIAQQPATRVARDLDGRNAAYVIFTSGSTGTPKGALLHHEGLRNRLVWAHALGMTSADVLVLKTPFSFDVSVFELFYAFIIGARLVVAAADGHRDPAYLARLIDDEHVTFAHFVPSMLGPFLAAARTTGCPSLRLVVCSGEALPAAHVATAAEVLDARLFNLYGPTEATIDVSWWDCSGMQDRTTVPIGFPVANTGLHILDAMLHPVPVGEIGELYLSGIQLARGYVGRPDLTAERFVPNPFAHGERMYRTGDLSRALDDSAIEYVGRADFQIKIRGLRIETGEIETVLAAHPAVHEAVVIAREHAPGDTRLVAYFIAEGAVTADELRAHAAAALPDYMIPSAFVALQAWPLTSNGKLDRTALPAPVLAAAPVDDRELNDIEAWLATTGSELLGTRIGLDDNFFAAGGHSLLLTQLGVRIQNEFGVEVPLRNMFLTPTVRGIAAVVSAELAHAEQLLAEIEAMSPEQVAALLAQDDV
jgi:amino acid adenylation domain-containing protein